MADRPKLLHFPAELPKKPQFGERLRIRIVKGANVGHAYCLMGHSIVIGRDEKCDLPIDDTQASRKHVELVLKKDKYFARDLDSANGLFINQKRIKGDFLESGDILTIGDTTFEVIGSGKQSIVAFQDTIVKPEAGKITEEEKKLKKNKTIVLAVFFVLVLIVFSSSENVLTFREKVKLSFDDEQNIAKKIPKKKQRKKEVGVFVPKYDSDAPGFRRAQRFYREGMRELNSRNYRRAIAAFETAQTVDPGHELSKIYLQIAKKRMESDVVSTYLAAQRSSRSLRYDEARMYYLSVIRLLEKDPNSEYYQKSVEAVNKIDLIKERSK